LVSRESTLAEVRLDRHSTTFVKKSQPTSRTRRQQQDNSFRSPRSSVFQHKTSGEEIDDLRNSPFEFIPSVQGPRICSLRFSDARRSHPCRSRLHLVSIRSLAASRNGVRGFEVLPAQIWPGNVDAAHSGCGVLCQDGVKVVLWTRVSRTDVVACRADMGDMIARTVRMIDTSDKVEVNEKETSRQFNRIRVVE
jgi:hypothetical protein